MQIGQDISVPGHIAFIMDGNGRWAASRGMPRTAGHAAAASKLPDLLEYLLGRGVHSVTLWGFSTENWKRPKKEVDFLMRLITKEMRAIKKTAMEKNVRVKVIGRRDNISTALLDAIESAELATFGNTRGTLCIALDYGGQDEIIRGVQQMLADKIAPEDVDVATFDNYLDSGDLTPIDLIVRTSGEHRLSNFMLWKMAFAEIAFIPEMWPDMNEKIMARILRDYAARDRRFGGIKE